MQPTYNQPFYQPQQQPQPQQSNGIGIAGFVCALCAIVFCWVPWVDLALWLLGLIFSIIGMGRRPRGLAIAGLVISLAGLVIFLILLAIGAAFLSALL